MFFLRKNNMGTQFEDSFSSGIDDGFGFAPDRIVNADGHTIDDDDAEKLIEDGNAHVLMKFEARKKSGDYARSQASRQKKAPTLNMASVDWSGFPGAAHKTQLSSSGERKSRTTARRSSLQTSSQSHSSLDKSDDPTTNPRSSSPSRLSPIVKKYKSRRHLMKTGGGIPGPPEIGEADNNNNNIKSDALKRLSSLPGGTPVHPNNVRPKRHGSMPERSRPNHDTNRPKRKEGSSGVLAAKARSERRSSESINNPRLTRRPSKSSTDRSKSRSKSRTRRPPTKPTEPTRSLSPSKRLDSRTHSSSPSGRMRRPVNAAAASTTLEVGRSPEQRRGNSRGRRKTSQKNPTDIEEGLFKKMESFKW